MYTSDNLQSRTTKELAALAAKLGVSGSRGMKKDELVRAVLRASKAKSRAKAPRAPARRTVAKPSKPAAKQTPSAKKTTPAKKSVAAKKPVPVKKAPGKHKAAVHSPARKIVASPEKTGRPTVAAKAPKKAKVKTARVVARIQKAMADRERQKNLATPPVAIRTQGNNGTSKLPPDNSGQGKRDRVVLLVRDAYWLQAVWELTRQSVERAQAAMAEQWHTAQPTLRLVETDGGATTSTAERVAREIVIHGGVTTWYIDVPGASKSYRVDIGYLSAGGKFYSLARSNTVTTPRPNNGDIVSENWSDIAEDCEKIYALSGGYSDETSSSEVQQLFEERLGRPMGTHSGTRFGAGADKMLTRNRDFLFEVDAEMIVYGTTKPNAHVTLAGNPIKLRPDGTFSARLAMPDRRQVLPIVASSGDGVEQRTVVLAVERNTKLMEPMIRESHE